MSGAKADNFIERAAANKGRLLLAAFGWCAASIADAFGAMMPSRIRSEAVVRPSLVWLVLGFLAIPTLFVIPVSFNQSAFLDFPPRGLTLKWYWEFFHSSAWVSATIRSTYVAMLVAALSMVVAVPAAFVFGREQFPGKKLLIGAILSPLILPRMVIAVALFYLLARLRLVGTDLALVLGHTVIAFPYVVITVIVGLQGYNRQFDRAAATLGADAPRTLAHVTLPLIKSSLIAAAIFAFMTSFDDLNVALFLTGGEQNTLPKQMWSAMVLQPTPILGVASTILFLVMFCFLLIVEFLRRRGGAVTNRRPPL